ncbi:MAG: chemotaxis protein CheW [Pseudomonadota bacterium]|nr:chemotaxis protein CheW [Pseudomonadota bacterium]
MNRAPDGGDQVFVTLSVAGQLCGVAVQGVRDVLGPQAITRIPLALPEIAGSLNLRGKIVTAINMRRRLGLRPAEAGDPCMSLVTEHHGELYALIVDQVTEVLPLSSSRLEPSPPTLPPTWRRFSVGVHRVADRLMVVLDLERVLDLTPAEA